MILAANFPKQQGIKQFDLEVFIDNEWKKINSYELSYQTSNEYREISLIKFEKQSFSKMKIKVNDANREWGHFIIAELYLIGNKTTTAQTVANSITDIKQSKLGQMYLEIPELLDDLKDKYLVEIKSSSNEEVISLDGKINPSTDSENVNIVLQVKDKDDLNEIGITKTFTIVVPKALSTTHKYIAPKTDLTSIIKNPGMGWVQYIEGFECRLHDRNEEKFHSELCTIDSSNIDDYWRQMDNLYKKGLPTNILYIRMPWSWFEPEEGKYVWKDKNSELSKLIKGAKERDLELAFRVVLDSSSMKDQAIPEWLFKNYNVDSWDNYNYLVDNPKKEVYLDDEVFLDKLSNFINAFGKEFNQEESNVAFIDGMGYGAWGETSASMRVKSSNEGAMVNTLKRIIDMYAMAFPDVLLGAQTGNSFGDYKYAIEEKGYVMRRDNFGSPDYMSDAARKEILYYISKGVPVYAENCYHHFESMKNNWGNYTIAKNRNETLNRVVNDAIMLHANTLDARVLEDCKLWIENDEKYGDHLIEKFALNGGYRLSLTAIQLPKQLKVNSNITIDHSWINSGVGFLPNKNSHWNNKYKVAFALLDSKTNEIVYQFNESSDNVNPGDWIKENGEHNYTSEFKLPENLKLGDYKFAVAIVNEKLNNQPDINLAIVDEGNFIDKWYVVDTISIVKNEKDELNKAIENTMKIDLSKYTTSSSESFIKVLEAAQLVANKEEATIEEMTTALINLNNAQNALKYLGDKTELNQLINEIYLLDSTQYTKSSWDELIKVLSKAIEVSKDLDVEQEDVDTLLEELLKIKNKLELRKDDEKDNIIIDKPSTEIKDNQVKTGDTSFIMLNVFFMIISIMSFSFMKRKKYFK